MCSLTKRRILLIYMIILFSIYLIDYQYLCSTTEKLNLMRHKNTNLFAQEFLDWSIDSETTSNRFSIAQTDLQMLTCRTNVSKLLCPQPIMDHPTDKYQHFDTMHVPDLLVLSGPVYNRGHRKQVVLSYFKTSFCLTPDSMTPWSPTRVFAPLGNCWKSWNTTMEKRMHSIQMYKKTNCIERCSSDNTLKQIMIVRKTEENILFDWGWEYP